MLGNTVLRLFAKSDGYQVIGTARSIASKHALEPDISGKIVYGVDVGNFDTLLEIFHMSAPDVVINCVGLVKQLSGAENPLEAIPINALLPHRLAKLCDLVGARLVHISTDCIFSGKKGMYVEGDASDACDMYGRSKFLGEVCGPNSITLRTSIIGHELLGRRSLLEWFLSQQGQVRGFKKAIFSGLPTIEVAKTIRDYVIPRPELNGIYHLSVNPIDKFTLLSLIAKAYGKSIDIIPDYAVNINRSLNSDKFRLATGFRPKPWNQLVSEMYEFK